MINKITSYAKAAWYGLLAMVGYYAATETEESVAGLARIGVFVTIGLVVGVTATLIAKKRGWV